MYSSLKQINYSEADENNNFNWFVRNKKSAEEQWNFYKKKIQSENTII